MKEKIQRDGRRPATPPNAKPSPAPGDVDVVGLLHEMKERLAVDFGFRRIHLAGLSHINRTTEPVSHFLAWLQTTPEAQAALELVLAQRKAGHPAGIQGKD
jgi:hypothetical protein